ncbi:MAG: MBL fold metallo-hydrolase [Desulfovibrio sp.]
MRVTFVGVGEAFDERFPNTSLLVEGAGADGPRTVLLDCGFTAAAAFFGCGALPTALRDRGPDAIWISHFHGDHYFGLPYALTRWHEQGRREPLTVYGGEGMAEKLAALVDMSYPNVRGKLTYPLQAVAVSDGEAFSLAGIPARAALTGHGAPCLALRLMPEDGGLYYSGDGAPTEACVELARGCGLVVQEAYGIAAGIPGHGSVAQAIELAREAGAGALAVVHVRREVRRDQSEAIRRLLAASGMKAMMPEPGDALPGGQREAL